VATLTINFTEAAGATGYIVKYKVKGSTDPYTTISPNPTVSPVVITGLLAATEYEGTIISDCVGEFNTITNFRTCKCPSGFIKSTDELRCEKTETAAPTVTSSNYCIATSQNLAYSNYFSRIYNPGFDFTALGMYAPPASNVYAQMSNAGLWTQTTVGSTLDGPMNKAGVWLDSGCTGTKNSLMAGQQTTLSFAYNSTVPSKTIYVGVGGDNQFRLIVNGVEVAKSGTDITNDIYFKVWHIIPVTLLQGTNYFNIVGIGDGSTNDAVGMTIYNNTAVELVNATLYSDLNVLFSSEELIGKHVDVVTCPTGYSLDTTGGVNNCIKVTRASCTGA
jgi:hypothetical protein